MGRIAATTKPAPMAPSDGGLLLDPVTDLWADWGLLGVPNPDRATTTRQGLLFRDFIRNFPHMSAVGARQHPQQGPLLDPSSGGGGTGGDGGNGESGSGSGSGRPSSGLLWPRRT